MHTVGTPNTLPSAKACIRGWLSHLLVSRAITWAVHAAVLAMSRFMQLGLASQCTRCMHMKWLGNHWRLTSEHYACNAPCMHTLLCTDMHCLIRPAHPDASWPLHAMQANAYVGCMEEP